MSPNLVQAIALFVAGCAAATDTLRGRIPNALTFFGIVAGLAIHGAAGITSLLRAACGLFLVAGLPWAMHRCTEGRAVGGGDVKLFAALGALLGPTTGLEVALSSFVLLGVFAVLRLAFAGCLGRVLVNAGFLLVNPVLPRRLRRTIAPESLTTMRLGPAIFVAVLTAAFADTLCRWVPWLG